MRHVAYFLIGAAAMLLIGLSGYVRRPPPGPVVGGLDPECLKAMRRLPDLTYVAPDRALHVRGHFIETVLLPEIPRHVGERLRIPGVLRMDSQWAYLSDRARSRTLDLEVSFSTLWPSEPYWWTKQAFVADRCVIVEGIVYDSGWQGAEIRQVTRLHVWSQPHRPGPLLDGGAMPGPEDPASRAILAELRGIAGSAGAREALARLMRDARARSVVVGAIGSGAAEWLDVAGALRRHADADTLLALREGVQHALSWNAPGVLRLVASQTFSLRDACRVDAVVAGKGAEPWEMAYYESLNMYIVSLGAVTDASLAATARECIEELLRERAEVLRSSSTGAPPSSSTP